MKIPVSYILFILSFCCSATNGNLLANPTLLADTTLLGLVLCPGETQAEYQGIIYQFGDVGYHTLTSSTGADSVVKVTVFQSPVLDFWATTSPICKGSKDGVIDFWDNVDITAPYQFSLDGGQTWSDEYTYTGLAAGYYELLARNRVGCVFEYELTIPTLPHLELETPIEVVGCEELVPIRYKLKNPPLPLQFQWQGPSGEVLSTDSLFQASEPGLYLLTITNQCDTIRRGIKVTMEDGPSDLPFFVPNSFSPNGDGINDCLQAHLSPSTQLLGFQFLIFDRWGGEVFSSNDLDSCWDGTKKGKALGPGTYVWMLKVRLMDCFGKEVEEVKKGEVNILR
jgi:gliding motility-associated-like protein